MVAYSQNEMDDIIARAQAGDREAIATIYEEYVDRVYRFVANRVENVSDAEDITAEVFMEMIKGEHEYVADEGGIQRWLYSIATACIARYEASLSRRPQVDTPLASLPIHDDAPENLLLREEQLADLRDALQYLSPEEYSVLMLRFVEGKSHEEVASIMKKSSSATRIMQFRALKTLAKQLDLKKKRHYLRPAKS